MPLTSRRQFLGTLGATAAAFSANPLFAESRLFGDSESPAAEQKVFLNYNENPYGPSPRALAEIRSAGSSLCGRYFPEDTYDTLRKAIAAHHGVTMEHIRVAPGSTEILKVCDDVFLRERPKLVVAEPAYEAVVQYAVNSRAETVKVPLDSNHAHDLPLMLAAVSNSAGMVYICNPNNPTGTIVRRDDMARFMGRVPSSVIVVVDEAYSEYVSDPDYESALRYVHEGRNVIVAKTFSKIHGLAGMRVGYAVGVPELVERLKPFTVDFAVTGVSANAALASLKDSRHIVSVARRNAAQRLLFVSEMRKLGFECVESHANFVMVNLRRPVADFAAPLAARGVFVGREFAALPSYMRVTLGTDSEMKKFFAAFRDIAHA